LAGATVHGDANVNASADILEELVEIVVGELEGKVAHEEDRRGVVALEAEVGALDELDGQAAAHEGSVVEVLDSGGRLVEVGELDITPAPGAAIVRVADELGGNNVTELLEALDQVLLGGLVSEVSDVDNLGGSERRELVTGAGIGAAVTTVALLAGLVLALLALGALGELGAAERLLGLIGEGASLEELGEDVELRNILRAGVADGLGRRAGKDSLVGDAAEREHDEVL